MTNRVIMGELPGGGMGLRVSRPGRNALNANLQGQHVAFDSRWNGAARILIRGNIAVPSSGTVTINYGETLPYIPVVLQMWRQTLSGGQIYWSNTPIQSDLEPAFDSSDSVAQINALLAADNVGPSLRIYNNRIVVSRPHPTTNRLAYIVLRR